MASLRQELISFPVKKISSSSVPSKNDGENVVLPPKASPVKRKQQTPAKKEEEGEPLHSPAKAPRKTLGNLTSNNLLWTPSSSSSSKRLLSFGGPGRGDPRMSAAKQSLSTAVPDEVIGREKEIDALEDFLENAWKSDKRSLYISGAPGTGKTACLKSCLSDFILAKGEEEERVQDVFINCMDVASPKDIYGKVALALDESYAGCQPKKFVEAKICMAEGKPLLLVLDEIDQLDCRSHEILYSIFEWPYLQRSRLVLIGIANALDLTDRILPRLKLSASITLCQLSFPAYTKEQINDIIVARLQQECCSKAGEPVIKPIAVMFLAGKIAAISGDVRQALDVCRRAIELAEIECQKQRILGGSSGGEQVVKEIDIPQILAIFNQVYYLPTNSLPANSFLKESNSDLPQHQKILLASLLLMSNYDARKCKEVSLGKLQETYGRVCKKRQMESLDLSEVSSLCSLLEARGFFKVKRSSSNKSIRERKISLRIDEKEVEAALHDMTLLTDILADTTCIAQ